MQEKGLHAERLLYAEIFIHVLREACPAAEKTEVLAGCHCRALLFKLVISGETHFIYYY